MYLNNYASRVRVTEDTALPLVYGALYWDPLTWNLEDVTAHRTDAPPPAS